jgi:aspartate aminotransferase-like enzyme
MNWRATGGLVLHCYLLLGCAASTYGDAVGVLAASDQQLDERRLRATCAGLSDSLASHLQQMKALQIRIKEESNSPPTSLLVALKRAAGHGANSGSAAHELGRQKEMAQAVNETLRAKGCQTVDIDAQLSAELN